MGGGRWGGWPCVMLVAVDVAANLAANVATTNVAANGKHIDAHQLMFSSCG